MNKVFVFLCLIVAVAAIDPSIQYKFNSWMKKYNKSYALNSAEYAQRLRNFESTLVRIERSKRMSPGTVFDVNQFSDMTVSEFRSMYLMNKTKVDQNMAVSCLANGVTPQAAGFEALPKALPSSWDWRTKNKVTPVKDQGQCGSCWAFSTVGCLESAYAIKNNVPATQQFSEQQIVDCSHACIIEEGQTVCNQGCDGGWMWSAMTDVMSWGGLETEDAYPYTGEDGTCNMQAPYYAAMSNYTCLSVPSGADETTLMPTFLVNKGPLSIALNADLLMDYSSGIINPSSSADCDPTTLDHALLIVGYGTSSGQNFWIVKNSWNQSWGEQGYFRIVKGTGACGINNAVVSPILA